MSTIDHLSMLDMRHISTDDRELERVNDACGHARCPPGECRAYTAESLEPTVADHAMALQLVADGWCSTSRRSCTVARWAVPMPAVEEMLSPEFLASPHGPRIADQLRRWGSAYGRHIAPRNAPYVRPEIEHAQLSLPLFRAFKAAGGGCW